MRSLPAFFAAIFSIFGVVRASDLPTVKAPLPDITTPGTPIPPIDLRNFFEVADIQGQVVQFITSSGTFNIELNAAAAPITVANFLNYVNGGSYSNSFVHRSDQGLGIIQGGSYYVAAQSPLDVEAINTGSPIALEYNLPNARGTLAMARTSDINSATSGWYINTSDNTTTLGAANGGGYAVFGRVTGTGMTVVDAIQALPVYNAGGAFTQLPLTGYTSGYVVFANLVVMSVAEAIPIFPASAGQNSVVSFTVQNSNTDLISASVSGSMLNVALASGQTGSADLTVTATDCNGNAVQNAFRVTVTAGMPQIAIEQPAGNSITSGGTSFFPLVNVGNSADLVFTIENSGTADLALSGTPVIALDGADAEMFAIVSEPASTIAASDSSTFTVRFSPTSSGSKAAVIHVASNDPNDGVYDINLSGTGNAFPVLTLPESPVIAEPTSPAGAIVNFDVAANDAEDGALMPTVSPQSGSVFPIGNTTVNVSATDSNGAQTIRTFTVRVAFQRPDSTTINVAASTGTPAPGAGIGALAASAMLSGFGPPAIGDFRAMAARVSMLAGRTSLAGIYFDDGSGVPSLAAYQGEAAPGISTAGVTFGRFADPVIAPSGSIAFVATLQGAAVRKTEAFGVWTNAFSPAIEMVLREGYDVPGLPAGTKLQSVTSLSLRDDSLLAVLTLRPAVGLVSAATDTVLIRMTGANTATLLLREGRALSGLAGSRIMSFSVLRPALGSEGQGRWHSDGEVLAKVLLYDGRTMLVKIAADGTTTPMLSTAAPATPVNAQAKWLSFGVPAMGSEGSGFAVAATLLKNFGGVVAGNDSALLFSSDGGVWNVFAREGRAAPITPAGPLYATLLDPIVNDAGQIAFIASLQGAGVTPKNRAGIFSGPPGNPTLVARLGAHPPDASGNATAAVWTRFITCALPPGSEAGVIFLGETSGGDTTVANNLALCAVDSHGILRRLLRTSDTLANGGSPIKSITLLNAVPAAYGTARSYNATGSIAILATLVDSTQSLVRVDVP